MRMPCVKTPKVLITAFVRKAIRVMVIAVKVRQNLVIFKSLVLAH